jgi:3,4-dihydroxyphthalate decarboxylase
MTDQTANGATARGPAATRGVRDGVANIAVENLAATRVELARACRVLAHRGLVDDVLGHVSRRAGRNALLVRCRGPRELGLRFTEPADIRLLDFDGCSLDVPDGFDGSEQPDSRDRLAADRGYRPPAELPIHTELLRARPDVQAVVHAHPRAVVEAGLAGLPLLPIVGAFDIPAMRLAEAGITTYPRAVLVHRRDLGEELARTMGSHDACVLVGHGLVTTGTTVAEAVLRALQVDSLARLSLGVVRAGGRLRSISDADRAELPDLGTAFNEALVWRHHLAVLRADGWDLEEPA